jgi:hypothetical protein
VENPQWLWTPVENQYQTLAGCLALVIPCVARPFWITFAQTELTTDSH